jgi:FkbM family methyltransferase
MKLELIQKYFTPTSVLDIGANIGQFHRLIKSAYPDANVYSVEANPNCEDALKFVTNHYGTQYKIALLSKDNAAYDFYTRKDDPVGTGNSIYKELTDFYSDNNTVVETKQGITLSELFDNVDLPLFDLIKIDTQGSELDIISGGIHLCKYATGILLEVSVTPYNIGAPLKDEVINFMTNLGFTEVEILDEIYPFGSHQQDVLFINNLYLNK